VPGLYAPLLDSPPLVRYGLPEYVQGTSPAVASHFVQAVEGRYHVRLVSLFCRLVADVTAANREVVLEYRDAEANRYALHGSAVAQTASQTRDYAFNTFQPVVTTVVDTSHLIPLSPLLLPPTFDFRVFVVNVAAGDQLSRIRFVWERFYTSEAPADFAAWQQP